MHCRNRRGRVLVEACGRRDYVFGGLKGSTAGPRLCKRKRGTSVRLRAFNLGVSLLAAVASLAASAADSSARVAFFDSDLATGMPASLLSFDTSASLLADKTVVSTITLLPDLQFELVQSATDQDARALNVPQSYGLAPMELPGLRFNEPLVQSTKASVNWSLSKWGGLSLSAEQNFGAFGSDQDFFYKPMSFNTASRSSAGVSAHADLGNGWVTSFSYDVGVTKLDLRPTISLADSNPDFEGRSYSVAIAKHGLFGDADSLKVSVSRPSSDYVANFDPMDDFGRIDLLSSYRQVPLSGVAETDVGVGYVTTFFGGALALQANAGYQMNVAGQSGTNSLTLLSRAKINF